MRVNMVGAFIRNAPFGTEIAFAKGMRRLGHEVNEVDTSYPDQRFLSDADVTIVFKWMDRDEYWERLEEAGGLKIVYQPDDSRFPHIQQMLRDMRHYADLALTFDQDGAEFARSIGYRAAEYMPVTADDELYCPSPVPVERDIDVSFVGSLTGGSNHASRRLMVEIVNDLAQRKGWRVVFGETYFGDGLTPVDVYRRSKVVLNHATDVGQPFGKGYGLQCRHFEVGMTATALLSNSLIGQNQESVRIPFWGYAGEYGLVTSLTDMIERGTYVACARNIYESMRRFHMPEHRAAEIVNFIERNK